MFTPNNFDQETVKLRWLMKNTAWSHDFLVRWWHSEILQGPGENHNCTTDEIETMEDVRKCCFSPTFF
jgi:hypothetical protein